MIRWLFISAALGLLTAGAVLLSGCYAHAPGPGPNCAANPYQEGCYPPVHDSKRPNNGGQ